MVTTLNCLSPCLPHIPLCIHYNPLFSFFQLKTVYKEVLYTITHKIGGSQPAIGIDCSSGNGNVVAAAAAGSGGLGGNRHQLQTQYSVQPQVGGKIKLFHTVRPCTSHCTVAPYIEHCDTVTLLHCPTCTVIMSDCHIVTLLHCNIALSHFYTATLSHCHSWRWCWWRQQATAADTVQCATSGW
jgi:hypothetical protein